MAKGGGGDQSDNSTGLLWIIAAILVLCYGLWYVYRVQMTKAYFALKLYEIKIIGYFTNSLEDVRQVIISTDPAMLNFKEVVQVGNLVGEYVRIPVVMIILFLA